MSYQRLACPNAINAGSRSGDAGVCEGRGLGARGLEMRVCARVEAWGPEVWRCGCVRGSGLGGPRSRDAGVCEGRGLGARLLQDRHRAEVAEPHGLEGEDDLDH
jgi:hypothetical protein